MDDVTLYWLCMAGFGLGIIIVGVGALFYLEWRDQKKQSKKHTHHRDNPYIQSVFQPRCTFGTRERMYQQAARDAREDNLSQIVAGVIVAEMMMDTANNITAVGNQN